MGARAPSAPFPSSPASCYDRRVEFPFTWLSQNWFNAVQTLGIVGSSYFTLTVLRRDLRSRRVADYLALTQQHRELWSELHRRPELARVTHVEVDLLAAPISEAEEEFLMLAFNHFHTGWLLVRQGGLISMKTLSADARAFFSLPLPRTVWEQTKHSRDPEFLRFIDQALAVGKKVGLTRRLRVGF